MSQPSGPVLDDVSWLPLGGRYGAVVWDAGGRTVAANDRAVQWIGGDAPGGQGLDLREVFGIADAGNAAALAAALGSQQPVERVVRRAGAAAVRVLLLTWPIASRARPLWLTVIGELANRTDADGHIDASVAHMELLFQRSPLMYFTVDSSGLVIGANRTALEQLGYEREELVGRPVSEVFHPDDRETIERQVTRCFGEPELTHSWEIRKQRRDGVEMWVAAWARQVPGTDDAPELLMVCEDVTARKRAEQALRDSEARLLQAQKQEALGRLAGGIAHDFSNLLTVVLGHADAARQLLSRDSPVLEELEGIREAAQQATNLSRQLLTFSRRQIVQPQPLQLDDVVARMTPLFRRLLGPQVALEVVWVPGLPRVLADPGQMEQVLTNLMVNARDAIVDRGAVRITSSLVSASSFAEDTGVPGIAGRTYLCVSIRDSGVGMSEDVRRRAFAPFFTTKADDRGTGLGLPTVQSIVQQAGGGVAIQSAPGEGCEIRVYLPTLSPAPEPARAPAERRPLPGGQETILLVEDREAVRRVAQRFLVRRGYEVIEAESAEQALALAEEQAGAFDLLLSDVVLGGMDGYELALTLTARMPGLKVVLMSGYPSEMLARAGSEGPVFPFVNKPIDFPTLAQLLRDLLDSRTG